MQTLKYYRLTIMMGMLLTVSSCEKFVEVEAPKTLLYQENVFNDNTTATSAMTSIYSQMMNNTMPYQIPYFTGLSGDELFNYSTFAPALEIYGNKITATNSSTRTLWENSYKYIYQANAVIEGVENSKLLSDYVKKQLVGEAKFIRAFWYFYLVNLYGDIPIITTTDYKINSLSYRKPVAEVYTQLISDLRESNDLLSVDYLDKDNKTITSERTRPTKAAALALLARVYLYNNDWKNAEITSTNLITSSKFALLPLNQVFLKNSREAIWQLQMVSTTYNTPEGNGFILSGKPSLNTTRSSAISPSLLTAFELGDNRRSTWVGTITASSITYNFPAKYKVSTGSSPSEYSMVFRLAEVYLIRAEARAKQDKISEAQSDLNMIRLRAGLGNTNASSQSLLIDAIIKERRVELFTEWGHRWFDLKRTGELNNVMTVYAANKGVSWLNYKKLYPIPQTEILNDLNITQNEGY
jgi:hypothetical protein